MSEPIRVSLDKTDFDCLVSGGTVVVDDHYDGGAGLTVEITLKDIGFDAMTMCISQARFNTWSLTEGKPKGGRNTGDKGERPPNPKGQQQYGNPTGT